MNNESLFYLLPDSKQGLLELPFFALLKEGKAAGDTQESQIEDIVPIVSPTENTNFSVKAFPIPGFPDIPHAISTNPKNIVFPKTVELHPETSAIKSEFAKLIGTMDRDERVKLIVNSIKTYTPFSKPHQYIPLTAKVMLESNWLKYDHKSYPHKVAWNVGNITTGSHDIAKGTPFMGRKAKEFIGGKYVIIYNHFSVHRSLADFWETYMWLMMKATRYKKYLDQGLKAKDQKDFINYLGAIIRAGYATEPAARYINGVTNIAKTLNSIINY